MFAKKEEKPSPIREVVQKLRQTEDMLLKKQEHLERKIDEEMKTAKANASKNKHSAMQALRRKRRFEKQLQQVDGTLSTLEMQREALEEALMSTTVLTTMKNAASVLKRVHLDLSVDQVNNLMDDIADQQELTGEILDAISAPVGFQDVDEDELEKELEALEEEALEAALVQVPVLGELPMVPAEKVAKPKAKKVEEDEDIKKLEKWAL
ncbi:Snf7 domain containing protein [Asbolus verrucosus]|uniref:Snf7 domain containing protein n=1 Tax=Asbolus verrucosus TaxID=1661398 RepID=A0A482WEA2_ASBVE|nr:Snf7 domain containing protein [Asbolus verrucosus]